MASKRGFASMDPAKRRAIASLGGKSIPPEKRAYSASPELAKASGRKGGQAVAPENRAYSKNRKLAAECGRKGGRMRAKNAALKAAQPK